MRALVVVVALIAEFALGFFAGGAMEPKPAHLIPPISIVKGASKLPANSPRTTPSAASRSSIRLSLLWPGFTPSLSGEGVIPAVSPSAVPPSRPALVTEHTSPSATPPAQVATQSPDVVAGEGSASGPSTESSPKEAESVWDRLARCESSGEWAINTGNDYFGGLQEDLNFWRSYGDPAYARPDLAPKAAQIAAAVKARDGGRGYLPWPQCSKKLGLRK